MNAPNGWDNKCSHVRPMPPQPPFRPTHHSHDSYSHECYHDYHEHPMPHELPTHGPMIGSGFMMMNYDPFLFDTTHVKYGNFLNVSECVNTRITRRRDDSCINLDATFNLCGQIMRNTVLQQHLESSIGNHFDTLEGVLPIIKSDMTIRLYYRVEDDMGGVVHQAVLTTTTPYMNLHFTDVRDYFVTSLKSIFVGNIPAMDYTGMYTLILQKIEIYGDILDTHSHMTGTANPYYQFVDNNNRIILQHDAIQCERPDSNILIAYAKLNERLPFQANITTRLRISFISFMSEVICVPQTYNIWNQLFEPSDEKMDRILNELTTLKESINMINHTLDRMQENYTDLSNQVSENSRSIDTIQSQLSTLTTRVDESNAEITSRLDNLEYRVTVLEQRPLALVRYQTGKEYQPSQLVYNEYGALYQSTTTFVATTFDADVNDKKLVPLSVEGTAIIETITQEVTNLQQVTNQITESINVVNEQIGNIQISLANVDDELTFYQGTEFPDTGSADRLYVDNNDRIIYVWNDESGKYEPFIGDYDTYQSGL